MKSSLLRYILVSIAAALFLPCAAQSIIDNPLRRTVLYRPGDFDSKFFRIPAIITAKDSTLVIATDRRKYSNADLPEDIDIILNYSADGTSVLLHSLPIGNERKNVSILISYDEGKSWPVSRVIVPYNSAYSSLCILPDGTIGMYVEEAPNGGDHYEMVFYNFTLDWLEATNH